MGKRALLIGVDHYPGLQSLNSCVRDTMSLRNLLRFHANLDANYDCITFLGMDPQLVTEAHKQEKIVLGATKSTVQQALESLFRYDDTVLFYFSGHGVKAADSTSILLPAQQDGRQQRIHLQELLDMANASNARQVIMILDCCFAGAIGEEFIDLQRMWLRPGVTVLAAASPDQFAFARDGQSVFTRALLLGLEGGVADPRGWVTPAALYAFIEQSLGPWEQRPMYKSNATEMQPIRYCEPIVNDDELRQIPVLFKEATSLYGLDKSFEPTQVEFATPDNVAIFYLLRRLQLARMVRPTNPREDSLYWTAMHHESVQLTPLGQYYWQLATAGKIGGTPAFSRSLDMNNLEPEKLAQIFHETYERLAPYFNYTTRRATAVPWAQVPDNNKQLMIAVATEVLAALQPVAPPDTPATPSA